MGSWRAWAAALSAAFAITAAAPAAAQPVFAVRTAASPPGQQRLVSFDTQSPGTLTSDAAISGLQSGETIVGMDFGVDQFPPQLYAIGSTSRVYTIDTGTGGATQVGGGPFSPALSGTSFAVESFDDVLRVLSTADQNLAVDQGNGTASAGANLVYATGDPNQAADPNVVAAGLQGENLFVIDSNLDVLAFLEGPDDPHSKNDLTTIGPLGVDTGPAVGFDVSGGVNPYAVLDVAGASRLYVIDTATGAATPHPSAAGNAVGATITGGIAVQPQDPQLQASPSPLDFGNQPLGTMGPATTLTIQLTGGEALESTNPAITGPNKDDFFLTADLCLSGLETQSASVPLRFPGDQCTVRIRFAPSAAGTRTAAFSFLQPKCCPSGTFIDAPLTGTGTNGPVGPTGPAGPTGLAGPQGPPGTSLTRLSAALLGERFTGRAKKRLRLPYFLTEAARVTIDVRRGKRRVARLTAQGSRGRNRVSWSKAGRAGKYLVSLTARTADGRRATDAAPLRIR